MRNSSFYDDIFNRSGHQEYDPGEFIPNLVFVIMAFNGEGSDEVYRTIQTSAQQLGLTACRADESVGSGMIIREITERIEAAEFIITDLTHERPNVYYELGYAGLSGKGSSVARWAKADSRRPCASSSMN